MKKKFREIIIAEDSGFCFGVKRAVASAYDTLKKNDSREVYILGDLIHNPTVVDELQKLGAIKIDKIEEIENPGNAILLVRSHGISRKILKKARELGINVIDSTCPFVKKIEELVEKLLEDDFEVYMIGDKNHPEVTGLYDSFDGRLKIVENKEQAVLKMPEKNKVGIVVQTTQKLNNFRECVFEILREGYEYRIFNTICESTGRRQSGSVVIAQNSDVIIVIGGKNSANTTRLFEICKNINENTFHIEKSSELEEIWFAGKKKIGITAGASTPGWIIEETTQKIQSFPES